MLLEPGVSHVEDHAVEARDEQEVIAVAHPTVTDRRASQMIPVPIVQHDVVAVGHHETFAADPHMRAAHVLHMDCAGDDRAMMPMMERRSSCGSAAQEG